MNNLYYGDCKLIMQDLPDDSIDLVYLDPPFNSNRDYNAIYKDETGRPLPDQIKVFSDLWKMDEESERAIRNLPIEIRKSGIDSSVAEFWLNWMEGLKKTQPNLAAYLTYMAERLLPLKRIVKNTGSIYLHCDPTASHYIKAMMDSIFGHKNFRREIIWNLKTSSGFKTQVKGFVRGHDVILYYVMGKNFTFNHQFTEYDPEYIKRFKKQDHEGRFYRDDRGKGRRQYLDEGKGVMLTDVWSDIMSFQQAATSKEILGYATQKPVKLLERIINASSNHGETVLDPFCGCASTLEAAHKLGRKWIGIDISIHAVKRVASRRLTDLLGLCEGKDYNISGIPINFEGAKELWIRDKYIFQKWAIEQVEGFVTEKKSVDGGVDGRLYFDRGQDTIESMILEVKGGSNVGISVIRDLRGTMERESALMSGLIVLEDLGEQKKSNFRREMADAGHFIHLDKSYPKMQILTIQEILDGKKFLTPSVALGHGDRQPVLPGTR